MDIGSYFVDVKTLPQTHEGFVQLAFLGGTYAYILCYASNMISDGSELLLLIPSMAGLIGSVVLPILGAVPDGCMVMFSGLGPNAQEELSVGIGTLAGSTIMLLTIPWFLSVIGGRVNFDPVTNEPDYKTLPKLDPPDHFDLFHTGVTIGKIVHVEAYVMLLTAMTYLVIQIPGLLYMEDSREAQAQGEHIFAQIGTGMCVLFFMGYLYLQYQHSRNEDSKVDRSREEFVRNAIASKKITLLGVMLTEYRAEMKEREDARRTGGGGSVYHKGASASETQSILGNRAYQNKEFSQRYMARLRRILKPFFRAYDVDNTNSLEVDELRVVFEDMGESLTKQQVTDLFAKFDKDQNNSIDYDEFVEGVCDYIIKQKNGQPDNQRYQGGANAYGHRRSRSYSGNSRVSRTDLENNNEESDDAGEEDNEMPDDIKHLSPAEQQRRIWWRAIQMMGIGSIIVIFVSDPLVDVMSEIGRRTGIPAFYVAFVLAPLASNASELVAAYNYSLKKTKNTISISLATLLGAAIMNNTFVLAVFLTLVWTQGLTWSFFAETVTILFVQLIMAYFAFKKQHAIMDAFFILSLYPLSLGLVYLLESYGWD